ncbi:MAG: amidohydrolase family protein [Anaerolineae bacterium]|nr:amidohydrolase family protein [Anaerolineae bacterium]
MIIDGDCHIGAQPDGFTIGAGELVRLLDENQVDRAIVWPMAAYEREFTADNAAIRASAARHPDRLIPFGGVNPRLGVDRALDEVKRCQDWDFRGIKLNGARDGYFIDDPRLSLPIANALAEAGMILALHCGSNDFERTHPFRVQKIARRFPRLPVWMVHMGGVGRPDEHMHEAAIEVAASEPNILLIASEAHPRHILKAVETIGAHRVCYASDTPFQFMHVMLAMMRALLRDLSNAERDLIMGDNLKDALML